MKPNGKRFLTGTLAFLALLAAAYLMIHVERYSLPYVEEGKAVVIRDEELGKRRAVEDVDATEDYIFLDCDDFIRAFNWNGNYCFSIRFRKEHPNGRSSIICAGELLYIRTPYLTTYVFQGDRVAFAAVPAESHFHAGFSFCPG